jgi:EpsI family protein
VKIAVALAFLALDFYVYRYLATEEVLPPRQSFHSFPVEIGSWRCPEKVEMDAKSLRILGVTDYVLCSYREGGLERESGEEVAVYVGYHESQVRRGGSGHETVIHPPEHCLPGAGWGIIDSSRVPISFEGLPPGHGLRDEGPLAKRFVIAKGEARALVYFWYQGQGRVVTANEDVILFRFFDRARRGRTDGALVRFTTPIHGGDVEAAEARFRRLASAIVPLLPDYVPE